MKTLYFECGMGAAGDMLMASLYELLPDQQAFLDKMNSIGLPGITVEAEPAEKCGITGTHMKVMLEGGVEEESVDVTDAHDDHEHDHHHHHDHDDDHDHHHHHDHDDDHDHHHDDDHDHDHHHHDHDGHDHDHGHHHHASVAQIEEIIDGLDIPGKVKEDAKAVYAIIADAESRVHGRPVDQIHFHEVGTLDAIADVVGVCLAIDMIGADRICASPVHTGAGYVRCAHGVLPVPAPATALILTGVPSYGGQIQGELCTPTGAALLKHFAASFGDRPVMSVEKIGYGMGKKDFPRANCVRTFIGEETDNTELIVRLECNLDDMTGEEIGAAMEKLFAEGANDVYTQPIGMKKSRPGVMLCVICEPEDADRLARVIMQNTSTLGIRRESMQRYFLKRHIDTYETEYGPVRVKKAAGMGTTRSKIEYDDAMAVARKCNISLAEAREMIRKIIE